MVTTEDVWRRLVENGLCPADQIELLQGEFRDDGEPADDVKALTNWLLRQEEVTVYQADVLRGKLNHPLRIGPYEIIDVIESGRLAGLYRARHQQLQFPVCLKAVRVGSTDEEKWRKAAQFQREARVAVQADHPHLLHTYQVGQTEEYYFLALENLIGQSLMELIKADSAMATGTFDHIEKLWDMERGVTRPEEVCRLIREAALGLAQLHDQEIVHRDVTPRNIWVTDEGHAKIIDFGLARDALGFLDSPVSDSLAAGFNEFLGSTDYLAPEQALDGEKASASSDVYGLGCTLYHALTGRVPYSAPTPAKQMIYHALGRPPLPSTLNDLVYPQLDEVVLGMMGTVPEYRYRSATSVVEALEPFLNPDDKSPYQEARTPQLMAFLGWLETSGQTYFTKSKKAEGDAAAGKGGPQFSPDDDDVSAGVEDTNTDLGALLKSADLREEELRVKKGSDPDE